MAVNRKEGNVAVAVDTEGMRTENDGFFSLAAIIDGLRAAGPLPGFGDSRRLAVLRWEIGTLTVALAKRLRELRRLTAGAEKGGGR